MSRRRSPRSALSKLFGVRANSNPVGDSRRRPELVKTGERVTREQNARFSVYSGLKSYRKTTQTTAWISVCSLYEPEGPVFDSRRHTTSSRFILNNFCRYPMVRFEFWDPIVMRSLAPSRENAGETN
jgi:hypothetical protein